MKIQYLANRGDPLKEREGELVVDQSPGDERRFVFERFNGKQIMVGCWRDKVWQRRDESSKWTKIGRPIGFIGHVQDYCPECDEVTDGEVRYRGTVLLRGKIYTDRIRREKIGDWRFECGCGVISDLQLKPDEPVYPEPEDLDKPRRVLDRVEEYAEVCNDEIFNGEIDLDRVTFKMNHRWKRVGGRANGYSITLSGNHLDRDGWNEFLDIVRHELIHVWQYHAEDGMNGGHDAQFHGWLVPACTKRHCL